MDDHLLIVDASGFAFRSFYTFPPAYRDSDGQPIGAVLGFMAMLWNMLGAADFDKPTHAVAVFDTPGKNFRHDLFPEYKANRDPARSEELRDQMPFMRHAAEALGLTAVEHEGFEADDVIATLAHNAYGNSIRSTIVSSDKDFAQLVVDNMIEIVDPMKKVRIREQDVRRKFGVAPEYVAHVQALTGDAVDNIAGLPTCGADTAARLIRVFGSVQELIERQNECRFPRIKAELKKHSDELLRDLKLTTLRRDVPLTVAFDDLKAHAPIKSHLLRILKALEAASRFQSIFGLDLASSRAVEPVEDEFAWWRDELIASGQRLPNDPQSGFYKRRLVKGAAFVPARIWRAPDGEGGSTCFCLVDGKTRDPLAEWPRLAMQPITQAEYDFMVADADHARRYRPDDPKADPRKPIKLDEHKPVKNPRRKD